MKFQFKKLVFSLFISGSIFFVIRYSIITIGTSNNIWFEAENPSNEITGFLLKRSDELSGGRGIVSSGGSHVIENFLEYDFTINSPTNYSVWARMYGENACGNSFYISFDNSNKYLIGNDDLMKHWHWLKGTEINLNPGKHKMFIWNQEQGTGIDRVLLTSNYSFFPTGKGESNDFQVYCDNKHANIFDYNDSAKWSITKYNLEKCICPKSNNKKNNYIVLKNQPQFPYYFKGEFYYNPKTNFNLLFIYGFIDSTNYSIIEINDKNIKKYKKNNGIETLINNFSFQTDEILKDKINVISFLNKGNKRLLILNGVKIEEIVDEEFKNGNIGLGTKTNNIYITNLSLTSNILPSFNTNFFDGIGSSEIVQGNWTIYRDPLYNISGKKSGNTPGVVINGCEYWNDYSFRCIIHFNSVVQNGGAGVIFNYQNENNYHLFEYENQDKKEKIKLLKVRNGNVSILGEAYKKMNTKQFYKFEVKELNDSIKAYIDEKLIFQIKENEDLFGKIGLYSNCSEHDVFFDDLNLYPTDFKEDSLKVFEYLFNNRLNISNDLSDWSNSYDILSPVRYYGVFKTKELFESLEIYNKKIFTDEFNLQVNASSIPLDIDFGVNLKSIQNKNNIHICIKRNSLILIVNDKKQLYQFDQGKRNSLEIAYKDLKRSLIINVGGTQVVDTLMSNKLEKYKLGIEFKGIGIREIKMPSIILNTNNYFVDEF